MASEDRVTYKEMTCAICRQVIPRGTSLELVAWTPTRSGKQAPNHLDCLSPPVRSSTRPAGPTEPVSKASAPAALPGDAPIYTYHRTLYIWRQGVRVGRVDQGVSVRGRDLLDIEVAQVDDRIRKLSNLNERGELMK